MSQGEWLPCPLDWITTAITIITTAAIATIAITVIAQVHIIVGTPTLATLGTLALPALIALITLVIMVNLIVIQILIDHMDIQIIQQVIIQPVLITVLIDGVHPILPEETVHLNPLNY